MTLLRDIQNETVMEHITPVRSKPKPEPKVKTVRKRKTSERKKLIKQLDQVVREIVLKRELHCVTCGKTSNLQCGHLITRSRYGVRWDLLNCHTQCSGCNFRHEFQPEIYTRWFIKKFGQNEYFNLCLKAELQGKYTIDELETMLMELTEENK